MRTIAQLFAICFLIVTFSSGTTLAATRGLVLVQNGTDTLVKVVDGVSTGEVEVIEGDVSGPIDLFFLDSVLTPFQPSGLSDSFVVTLSDPLETSVAQTAPWQFEISSIGEHGIFSLTIDLYLGPVLDYTSPAIELHVEPDHAEAEGLRLVVGTDTIVSVNGALVTGEIAVAHLETSDTITVWFVDAANQLFQPEVIDGFALRVIIADSTTIASYTTVGDWAFTVTGLTEAMTTATIGIFHVDHLDYVSPAIELHVEPEHAEAEGLRLVHNGDTLVYVDGAIVSGTLSVRPGFSLDSIDVWFYDIDNNLFQPEVAEGFALLSALSDTSIASVAPDGDWSVAISGVSAGQTQLVVEIFHQGHSDYTAPPINVRVNCCVGSKGNVDCSADNGTDLVDLTVLVDNLFISFTPLCCREAADFNSDNSEDLVDLTILVDFLFINFTPLSSCN